ncbi:MAG TPA: hypothetical protein VMR77_02520 [Patescibacteria group bacterium]|nr:hypothetical protein [Patescibacteria group bacterium]
MKNIKLVICLFAYLLILAFVAPAARAQSPTPANYDVTVSPVFFDLTANPGDSLSNKIRFRNNTTSPLPIKITVEKMTGDVNGDLTLREDNSDQSLSWVKFSQQTFVANPLEWTDVPFTIDIPKDAAYGYYFAVSFTQDNNSPIKRTGATITGAAAVPILLDVKKAGAKADAKIVSFSADNYVNEYLPVNFSIKVQNQGNIHVSPHGNIFINEGNQSIASLDVNPTLGNIIPDTNKTFTVPWSDGFLVREPVLEAGQPKLDKNGKPIETITINWDKLTSFRIGKYTANLLLVYDNGTRDVPLEANISFWVFPWKVVGLMIVTLIVIVLLGRFLLKFYINREVRKRLGK